MLKSLEKPSYIEISDILRFLNKKGIYIKTGKDKYKAVCDYCTKRNLPTIVKQEWFKELKETYLKPSKEELKNKTKGIVQGASVSGTLSNIYMLDADKRITKLLSNYKYIYRRYVDDFIIIVRNIDEETYNKIITKVKEILDDYKLELKDSKIQKFTVDNAQISGTKKFIQFLGFEIHSNNIVKIRQSTMDRWEHKLLKSKKIYLLLKQHMKEEALKKIFREENYHKLENIKTKNYRKRTLGTYVSKSIAKTNNSYLKQTKMQMANNIDKHIN